jgi:ABC-type multidrug transport system fused ATPase/permease subunit
MASFEPIEDFLLGQSRVDLRKETSSSASSVSSQNSVAILLPVLVDLTAAISISCSKISPSLGEPILSDIDIRSEVASINMLAGPVGCGKSTILKAILGEVSFTGNLFVSSERIAYRAQPPWLINDTLKQNVLGLDIDTAIDDTRYKTILHASGMDEDIMLLPSGDQTVISSRGTKLSGGQKQRLVSSS